MGLQLSVDWRERSHRRDWQIVYTTIGARVTAGDGSVSESHDEFHRGAQRLTAEVLVGLAGGVENCFQASDEAVQRWAATVRRILQRGSNPSATAATETGRVSEAQTSRSVVSLFAANAAPPVLDQSIELHSVWEVPFWEIILNDYPSLAPWIVPQVSLEGLLGRAKSDGEERWVDFVFFPPWRESPVVLEIDGSGHERSAAVDDSRDKELSAVGIYVHRIPGEQVLSPDARFRLAFDRAQREAEELRLSAAPSQCLRPVLLNRLSFALTLLANSGALDSTKKVWQIALVVDDSEVERLAGSSLDLLLAVDLTLATGVMPDRILINGVAWKKQTHSYSREPSADRHSSSRTPSATVILQSFDLQHASLPDADGPTVLIRPAHLPGRPSWWPEMVGERWNLPDSDHDKIASGLTSLARRLFGYPELRPGQLEALLQVLRGEDSVVLLPTGSGKSLIYQLAALLRPGLCLVVDPIRSLIDDQERRLISLGIDRVAAIHAERVSNEGARAAIQATIASGDAIFAFITPERLLNRTFREAMSQAASTNTINLAVIDEAHCVSEWGHSFRTAFLRLGGNLRRFGRDRFDVPPPLLALTGTASPAVLADTLRELEIDGSRPGALQRPDSFDRPNLRYAFLSGPVGHQSGLLREAIDERIPSAANLSPEEVLQSSGIVFVPHVNGSKGLIASRRLLKEALGMTESTVVGMYGGKVPSVQRTPIMSNADWEKEKRKTASDFVEGRLPLLVATKAFGMGIDKPDIRFTVHLGYPSSIEAFAQEAGRAGRDGMRSACVIVAALPEESRVAAALERISGRNAQPAESDRKAWSEDDWGTQLWLLDGSFKSREQETSDAISLFDALRRMGAIGGAELDLPPRVDLGDRRSLSFTDRATDGDSADGISPQKLLYRLSTVGVVDDIEYVGANNLRVHFAYFDDAADESGIHPIDRSVLAFLQRNDPGRLRLHEARVAAAPQQLDARVHHHLRLAVGAVYDVIYPARVRALEAMHRLVADDPDDAEARSRIVAYLHEGPMSTNLQELVTAETVEVTRALRLFDASPPSNDYEWQGAADRMLESFPNHPLVLTVRAVGETHSPQGREDRFGGFIAQLLEHLPDFGLDPSAELELVSWLLRQVRSHPRHDRRGWLEWAWAAITTSRFFKSDGHRALSNLVLSNAAKNNFVPEELNSVIAIETQNAIIGV